MKKATLKMKRAGMKRKNKKGGAFAIGMVIVVIVLMGFTWRGFVSANRKIDSGVSSLENITEIYKVGDRLSFYLGETARLSAYQSFYNIAKEAAIDIDKQGKNCFTKSYQNKNIVIWDTQCKPDQKIIEQKFLSEYNKTFSNFLSNYPEKIDVKTTHARQNEIITTAIKTVLSAEQKAAYAIYNLSHELNENYILNPATEQIYLADFPDIYDMTNSKLKECREKTNVTEQCLKEITFTRWNFDVAVSDKWILFEFETKRLFFFEEETGEEKFEKIKLNFGLIIS